MAIVTGSGMEIGKAAAILLAREGTAVALLGINDELSKNVVDEIKGSGGKAEFWHVDVRNSQRVAAVFAEIDMRFRGIQVLVNNAGILGIQKDSDESKFMTGAELTIDGGYTAI